MFALFKRGLVRATAKRSGPNRDSHEKDKRIRDKADGFETIAEPTDEPTGAHPFKSSRFINQIDYLLGNRLRNIKYRVITFMI